MARYPTDPQRKADVPDAPVTEIVAPAVSEPEIVAAPAVIEQAAAVPVAVKGPSLLAHMESALAKSTDARVQAALSTLVTLLHEMRVKFAAAEHLIADDLRARIQSIL